jgi:transglutaminase-like putative cysteine protease/tetratricopeptide (TPR) repeat protein
MKDFSILLFLAVVYSISSPVLAKSHLELANEYAEQSEHFFQEAVNEYNLALKDPKSNASEVRFLLGKLYYQDGKYREAIKELSQVYEKEKDNFAVAKLLALSHFMQGDYTEALAIFDKYEESKDDEFLYFYGRTCEKQNLFDQAIKVYTKTTGKNYKLLASERMTAINAQIGVARVDEIEDRFIRNLIKNAPGQEEYLNAGAIILLDDEKFEILPDYTATDKTHFIVKILNDRGKHYGEVELDYDSTYEKVELEYARTIRPDGTIVPVGDKHIRDVSRYLNYPLYSNARVKIISMPEVTEGAIIEYKARWDINKLVNKKDFSRHYGIQGYEPYLNQKLTIVVPVSYEFNFKSYNPGYTNYKVDFSPEIKEVDNKRVYTWEFKNAPEIIVEPSMPPWQEIVPSLSLSSFNRWEEIYDWWWNLAKDKVNVDEEIERKVKELTKGKKTEEEKTKAIYHWVASKVRYVAVEYGQAGFEPHSAIEIFKNKYGDCKDQAMLLIAMLRCSGISAHPVLIGTKGCWVLDEEFPVLTFNHAIVEAEVDGKTVFLDPTAETASFGDLPTPDQDRKVLVFYERGGRIEKIPLFPSEHNKISKTMEIRIDKDETISATREVKTSGMYDQSQRAWLKYTKPVLVQEELKEKINTITPGGELLNYRISNVEDLNQPVEIRMEFKGPKFLTRAGKNRLLPKFGSLSASLVSKERRNFPLDFQALYVDETRIRVEIPSHLTVKFLPPPIVKDTPWFTYIYEHTFSKGLISFEERLIDKKSSVSVEEYPEFKEVCEELARQTDKQVILEELSP